MEQDELIAEIKALRKEISGVTNHAQIIAEAIARSTGGRNVALTITHLEDAKMRLGMALGELGHKLPEEFRDEAE